MSAGVELLIDGDLICLAWGKVGKVFIANKNMKGL